MHNFLLPQPEFFFALLEFLADLFYSIFSYRDPWESDILKKKV